MSENNCSKLKHYFKIAIEKLNSDNKDSLYDENKRWEKTARKILNIANSWKLKDLNTIQKNFPAIDLGEDDLKIGIQVSTDGSIQKINDMLSKVKNCVQGFRISDRYNELFLFVVGYNSQEYETEKFRIPAGIKFDETHIWDFTSFEKKFEKISDDLQNNILDVLENDLCIRPKYKINAEPITYNYIEGSRENELEKLDSIFKHNKNVFLWGLGGIGKTELALAWRVRKINMGEDVHVLHYKGNIIDTVLDMEFSGFEYSKHKKYKNDSEMKWGHFCEKLDILKDYYEHSIIIIDNFDKNDSETTWIDMLKQHGFQELIKLKTRFLFTTRFEVTGASLHVEEMSIDDLLTLFRRNLEYNAFSNQEDRIRELIYLVDCHTLTVEMMSKSIHYSYGEMTVEKMINAYKGGLNSRKLPEIEVAHNSEIVDYDFKQLRILQHLKKLFELSKLDDIQKDVMCHAYLLPQGGINISKFRISQTDAENDVLNAVLIRRSWLRVNPEHTYISMHSVIHQVCADELILTNNNCACFLKNLYGTISSIETQYEAKPVYDTIINAADVLKDEDGEWTHLAGNCYRFMGQFGKAEEFLTKALKYIDHYKASDPEKAVVLYNDIALAFNMLRKNEEAVKYNKEALEMARSLENYELKSKVLNDLGNACGHLAEEKKDLALFEDALNYLQEDLQLRKSIDLEENSFRESQIIHNIGNVYAKIGYIFHDINEENYHQALKYHQDAYMIRQNIPHISDRYIAQSLNALGNDFANLGDNTLAMEYRTKALEKKKGYLLDNHPEIANQYMNIGHSYRQLKKYSDAIEYYKKAEKIWEKNHFQKTESIVTCEYYLLLTFWEKANKTLGEDLDYAEQYGEKAKSIAEKNNIKKHYVDIISLLAEIYGVKKESERQIEMLALKKSAMKSGRIKDSNLRHLAECAWKNKDFNKAESYYLELLKVEQGNKNSKRMMDTLFHLGIIKQNIGQYDSAIEYLNEALKICEEQDSVDKRMKNKYEKTLNNVINAKKKHSYRK